MSRPASDSNVRINYEPSPQKYHFRGLKNRTHEEINGHSKTLIGGGVCYTAYTADAKDTEDYATNEEGREMEAPMEL